MTNFKNLFLWTSLTRRVDFSLSFTLVISQFDQEWEIPKRKRPIDFPLYFTNRRFLIIILLFYLFFDFQRGYGTTERLEFILTEVNE